MAASGVDGFQLRPRAPELELSLELSSQPSSLLDDQFEMSACVGEPPGSRLIAVRLLETPGIPCASTKYLEAMPGLTEVADLVRHNRIVLRQFVQELARCLLFAALK
ncbi:hypothetical protein J2W43_002791 [Pseudomonas brassicacearum]|uniref:Uncharacterized protein n=1 Tax=Pseudomonas brassicacearum TaxID=930166 RepID=A0AAW8MBB6_9PSED|nr:hypothetical protein [Pseudomonas brassicacearum]